MSRIRHCCVSLYGTCPVVVVFTYYAPYKLRNERHQASIDMSIERLVPADFVGGQFVPEQLDGYPEGEGQYLYRPRIYSDPRRADARPERLENYRRLLCALDILVPSAVFDAFMHDVTSCIMPHNVLHRASGVTQEFTTESDATYAERTPAQESDSRSDPFDEFLGDWDP